MSHIPGFRAARTLLSDFQQPQIEVHCRISCMSWINGHQHVSSIVPPRRPNEQHRAGAVQDELPICVSQKGLQLTAIPGRFDNDQIGAHRDRTMASYAGESQFACTLTFMFANAAFRTRRSRRERVFAAIAS